MSINLDKLCVDVEYNILLIGRTGRGKSTFINAFANYLKYASLDEAIDGGCEEVIATRFELADEKTGESIVIRLGNDENEVDWKRISDYYTQTQNNRVYSFRKNSKLIRLIDTPGMGLNYSNLPTDKSLYVISQCLGNFPKLHAIVVVMYVNDLDYYYLSLLQVIHKNASTNVVFCCAKDLTFKTSNQEMLEKLRSDIEKFTKIIPKHGDNVLALDNCAYQCLIAQKQGHAFSEERIYKYRSCWIETSKHIQTMIDSVANAETCKATEGVELIQSWQKVNSCLDLIKPYSYIGDVVVDSNSAEFLRIVNLLRQNQTEYEKIEDICAKLWAMVNYSSVIRWDGFNVVVKKSILYNKANESIFKFLTKLSKLYPKCESFEALLSQHSSPNYIAQLCTELQNLQHSGPHFTERINEILFQSYEQIKEITITMIDFKKYSTKLEDLIQLQKILSLVTENNHLLVSLKNESTIKCDLTNATLSNVVFTFGHQSTNQMRDFIVNKTNTSQEDIELILTNVDQLIKFNFDNLSHVIKNSSPTVKQVVTNEEKKRINAPARVSSNEPTSTTTDTSNPPSTSTLPDVVSQFRPFMQHLYQKSVNEENDLSNKVDRIVEQMLKLKAEIRNKQ